jgi:chromosome segregation ATPase
MSATETTLLILLGFSLASLIALFMGRMLWTTGVKVGASRMQRQVPSTLVGLQTERDRLRAEYAMLAQRLGAKLEEAKLRQAENLAEVSRHRNRIQHVESSESTRQAELRAVQSQVKELERGLAEAKASAEELREALATKEAALQKLRKKKGYEGYKVTESAPEKSAMDPELRLRDRIEKLSAMAKPRTPDEDDLPMGDPIAERLAEAEHQTSTLEADLKTLEAEWSKETTDNVIALPNRKTAASTS